MTRRLPRRGVSMADVVIVVVLIVLLIPVVLVLLPSGRSHGGSNHVRCMSNLKQIGLAILLYTNENRGHYPRVTYVPSPDVTPTWGTGAETNDPFAGPRPNDVSAAMFLLLRTQDITSEVFTCPSSNAEKDRFGGGTNAAINRANFTDIKKNLSYSLHNPYPNDGVIPATDKAWWTNNMSAEFVVAADINPGNLGDKNDNVLRPNDTSSAAEMKYANSDNHDHNGQNVLFGDGHVEYLQHPFVGVKRDNIYTTGNRRVVASPVDANDSVLLPTDD